MTSRFGPRQGAMHRGVDLASITPGEDYSGAAILAPADGFVVEARGSDTPGEFGYVGGFGCWVILEHDIAGDLLHTVFGHIYRHDLLVQTGDRVKAGQIIARVGGNGGVAPHLHFEVWVPSRYTGEAVDPEAWTGAL